MSRQCRLFIEEVPPCVMAIERVYPRGSTMHIVPMHDDFTRVVVEEVRDVTIPIPMPIMVVKLVEETLRNIHCMAYTPN